MVVVIVHTCVAAPISVLLLLFFGLHFPRRVLSPVLVHLPRRSNFPISLAELS